MSVTKQLRNRVEQAILLVLCLALVAHFGVAQPTSVASPVSPPLPNTTNPDSPVPIAPVSAPVAVPSPTPVPAAGDQCYQCRPGSFAGSNCSTCNPGSCPTLNQCSLCPVGHFSPDNGTVKCATCDIGYFANATGTLQCLSCPPGRFCDVTGMNHSISCPPGTYCPAFRSTSPVSCSAGFYCPRAELTFPIQCPTGTYCPQVHTITPLTCPANHYCIAGSIAAESCPALYKSNSGSSKCSPAPSFFVLVVGVIVVVIAILGGIYIYKTRCMSERVEDIISTKRTRPRNDRTRLLPDLDDDDYGYNGT